MPTGQVVDLGTRTLQQVVLLAGPILAVAVVISLIINIIQVLTSLQEATLSTVPRLAAVAGALFFMMPWMWRQMAQFTVSIMSDFRPFVR
jgi:flagellar biosynthetic protein FliQ